jgi:hypothetical protein
MPTASINNVYLSATSNGDLQYVSHTLKQVKVELSSTHSLKMMSVVHKKQAIRNNEGILFTSLCKNKTMKDIMFINISIHNDSSKLTENV